MPSRTKGPPQGGLGAGLYCDGNRGPPAALPRTKLTRFLPGPARCVTFLVICRATDSGYGSTRGEDRSVKDHRVKETAQCDACLKPRASTPIARRLRGVGRSAMS